MLDTAFSELIEDAATAWDVPAVAVGVWAGGREETAAIGCTPATVFHVASITKPFTALLALDFLDLDAGTGGIWSDDVRVRHLLSHTSGYDCECGDLSRFGDGDGALAAAVRELSRVRRWVGLGRCWSYSNAGYWLTAGLCSEAAGSTYEDALAERVLRPGGLEATSFRGADLPGTGPDAAAAPYPRARRPSGGLTSNVLDLLRFGRRLIGEPRLRVVHGEPVDGVYGLGLGGERVGGAAVWGHGGSWGGYQSSLLLVPERDAVFVGLTNGSRGRHVLEPLEDAFFLRVLGAGRPRPETVLLPDEALRSFAGAYSNGEERFDVAASDGRLRVAFADGEAGARPIGTRTFEITDGDRSHERFDFPLAGFARFGSRLAERVP